MEDESRCKLKISIDNVNSEGEVSSDSGTEFLNSKRRAKHSYGNISGDENSKDSDKEGTISVSTDRDKPSLLGRRSKTYTNKAGTFVIGFDPTSQECKERQEQRAKRFGVSVRSGTTVTEETIQKLYESLGVSPSDDKEENGTVRFDALHIQGVDELSTSRVFDYFAEFAPAAIEWIDDTSCNVVWLDKIVAARAILKLSFDPAMSEGNAVLSPDAEEMKQDVEAVTDVMPTQEVSERLVRADEPIHMEDEDDDLNLLSDDDVAKLSHSTITAEENRAEIAKRRLSTAEDKSRLVVSGQEEEDMEVEEITNSTAGETEQSENRHSEREPSSSSERTGTTNRNKIQRIRMNDSTGKMPPGKWRIGVPHPRAKHLFMRFATKADVKQPGAGKRSKYYQKYGNPNFGGMKGIISGSRKRKIFSKKYQDELEEARKAIEEAKWKRGIPDETKFDQHVEEAVSKRIKTAREPVALAYSDGSEDSSTELVVEDVYVRPPVKKRFMKMHADDIPQKSLSERLGARNDQNSRPPIMRNRLGVTGLSQRTANDSLRRHGEREASDLRNRLSRR